MALEWWGELAITVGVLLAALAAGCALLTFVWDTNSESAVTASQDQHPNDLLGMPASSAAMGGSAVFGVDVGGSYNNFADYSSSGDNNVRVALSSSSKPPLPPQREAEGRAVAPRDFGMANYPPQSTDEHATNSNSESVSGSGSGSASSRARLLSHVAPKTTGVPNSTSYKPPLPPTPSRYSLSSAGGSVGHRHSMGERSSNSSEAGYSPNQANPLKADSRESSQQLPVSRRGSNSVTANANVSQTFGHDTVPSNQQGSMQFEASIGGGFEDLL